MLHSLKMVMHGTNLTPSVIEPVAMANGVRHMTTTLDQIGPTR